MRYIKLYEKFDGVLFKTTDSFEVAYPVDAGFTNQDIISLNGIFKDLGLEVFADSYIEFIDRPFSKSGDKLGCILQFPIISINQYSIFRDKKIIIYMIISKDTDDYFFVKLRKTPYDSYGIRNKNYRQSGLSEEFHYKCDTTEGVKQLIEYTIKNNKTN